MSYNQYPPPGQYDPAYGAPPAGQQQWGQPPQPGYGGYPPPGPPQQPGGGYPPPGAPPQQPGGYPPYGAGGYVPPPGAPAQPSGYGAVPPAQGGYAPPPQPGAYAPYTVPPTGAPGAPPTAPYATHPGQPAHLPPAGAPPAGAHGTPHVPYGAPPAQPYGVPPPHQPYGAPPPQGYGGYPAPTAPLAHHGPLMYLGVPIPPAPPAPANQAPLPGFDVTRVVETVRKAMKGFGTDERALTAAIAPLDAFQVDALRRTFESTSGKNLVKTIEKETSSWYEYSLRAKVLGPVLFDCWLLHRACDGAGTHEDILTEMLLDRTNSEIQTLKSAYQATYGRDLISTVRSELSAKTERLFNMALVGNREEGEHVDQARVQADVKSLYKAGEGKVGTDEITISSIVVTRSPAHLRALVQAYHQAHRRQLSKAIDREFSGHMDTALQHIVTGAEGDGHGVHRDVDLIQAAMKGLGTKDERLIYRIIRAHWNKARFEAIKATYKQKYNKTLAASVRSETGGDYRDFMCAVIGN